MTKTMTTTLGASAALAVVGFFATPAADAQEASSVSQFERPYGYGFGDESRPFDAGSRDINGNRVIVNGRIMTGTSTLSGDLNTMWGQTEGASGMLGKFISDRQPTQRHNQWQLEHDHHRFNSNQQWRSNRHPQRGARPQ